jgi:hypothetical protein
MLAEGHVVGRMGDVEGAVVVGCCWPGMVANITWGGFKEGGTVRPKGLITELGLAFGGGHKSNIGGSKSFSGWECCSESRAAHASVVGGPNELPAEEIGENDDNEEAAESHGKSIPKSWVSKKVNGGTSGCD